MKVFILVDKAFTNLNKLVVWKVLFSIQSTTFFQFSNTKKYPKLNNKNNLKQANLETLQQEGLFYNMAELVLNSGENGNLKNGWTLALINSLEMNSLEEIVAAVRLG